MKLGPLVILLWFLLMVVSCVAVAVHARRHGLRATGRAWLAPLGAGLSGALVYAFIGAAELNWSPLQARMVAGLVFGCTGLGLCVIGWRAAMRPRANEGDCRACGYAARGAERCPECGSPVRTHAD